MTDESSLTDALSEARNEEERRKASHGLDAFHQTFNFCMSCRQYTCAACWNADAGTGSFSLAGRVSRTESAIDRRRDARG